VNTVLEGDLGTTLGKSQHVVVIPFTDAGQVVIDGFLIQGGYSTGGKIGAGIMDTCTPLFLRHCTVMNNQAEGGGGGLYITGGCIQGTGGQGNDFVPYPEFPLPPGIVISLNGPSAHLAIVECVFDSNVGTIPNGVGGAGGGVNAKLIYGDVVSSSFVVNRAPAGGGAMYVGAMQSDKYVDSVNCVFWANKTSGLGGALGFDEADQTHASRYDVINCTFADNSINNNTTSNGQALASTSHCGPSTMYNSILYYNNNSSTTGGGPHPILAGGTLSIDRSDIQGGAPAGTTGSNAVIFVDDPLFNGHRTGRLGLKFIWPVVSPCIDAADYDRLPPDTYDLNNNGLRDQEKVPFDLEGALRWWNNTVVQDQGVPTNGVTYLDMGAYEQGAPVP